MHTLWAYSCFLVGIAAFIYIQSQMGWLVSIAILCVMVVLVEFLVTEEEEEEDD